MSSKCGDFGYGEDFLLSAAVFHGSSQLHNLKVYDEVRTMFKGDHSVSSSPALNWGRIAMAKPVITAQVGSWLELRERDEEEARSALLLEKTVIL
ncbi:hypothetical protein BELL_0173g00090 [Botrytis elliptica]|uniref:Uncharacterized protein n=1 Tax=Botrytis elliptica TaxID=278938 RepID=A0A4Z1JXY5_9HELO|nr:hypothetical protein BELL_0173g00090 [Botrytis elliptica]